MSKILVLNSSALGSASVSNELIQHTLARLRARDPIHSAKLLMLSGVGDAAELRKFGIEPVANLRGVVETLRREYGTFKLRKKLP
jgi:hypothetical protein